MCIRLLPNCSVCGFSVYIFNIFYSCSTSIKKLLVSINLSSIKMFFTAHVLSSLRLFKLKTERQKNLNRKPHQKSVN